MTSPVSDSKGGLPPMIPALCLLAILGIVMLNSWYALLLTFNGCPPNHGMRWRFALFGLQSALTELAERGMETVDRWHLPTIIAAIVALVFIPVSPFWYIPRQFGSAAGWTAGATLFVIAASFPLGHFLLRGTNGEGRS